MALLLPIRRRWLRASKISTLRKPPLATKSICAESAMSSLSSSRFCATRTINSAPGRAHKLRINVALPIGYDNQLCDPAQPIGRHSRALDPEGGFFVFNAPWSSCSGLLRRSGPDARMDHTEDRLIFNVNRHHRMAKSAPASFHHDRLKASPSERSCEEVDLGRILSGNNSPSGTSRRQDQVLRANLNQKA